MSTLSDPEGRRLLRIEVRNARTPIEKKPEWIRTMVIMGRNYRDMRDLSHREGPHMMCTETGCPDIYECWQDREATLLLGGAVCMRHYDLCDIVTGRLSGHDQDEPRRIVESVAQLELRCATIMGVTRDDLPDGTARLYAETCRRIHELSPSTDVKLLVDDFRGHNEPINMVTGATPQVFIHNLETVPRIFKKIHPASYYERSLAMTQRAYNAGMATKSNLILGMGEARGEISETLHDLHSSGHGLLTITQYLRPSVLHHSINRWVRPEEFLETAAGAEEVGFAGAMAGPLVRSSYRAGLLWAGDVKTRGFEVPACSAHLDDSASTLQETSTVLARLRERRERRATVREEVGA